MSDQDVRDENIYNHMIEHYQNCIVICSDQPIEIFLPPIIKGGGRVIFEKNETTIRERVIDE